MQLKIKQQTLEWFPVLFLLLVPIIHKIEVLFSKNTSFTQEMFVLATSMEYLWFSLLLIGVFSKKFNFKNLTIIAILSIVLYFCDFFIQFADWLFYSSPLADNVLKNYHTKDKFGLIFLCFIIFFIIQLISLIISFIKKNVEFQKIILFITTTILIVVTSIHHLYIIEYKYQIAKKEIWEEMTRVSILKEDDFKLICKFKNWIYVNAQDEKRYELMQGIHKDIRKQVINIFNNTGELAKFTFTQEQPDVELFATTVNMKKNNRWMVDTIRLQSTFVKSEKVLVGKLSFASFFWYYFTICALIAHRNRKFKFKGVVKNDKNIMSKK